MEFQGFPKMARLSRDVIISEKIDGTNACIFIGEDGEFLVGSRTRWITPEQDNHGFAKWAYENRDDLMKLGPGQHFGEWWGCGINRGYGLKEKRFSLFNVQRWCSADQEPKQIITGDPRIVKFQQQAPACCWLVPVLWHGEFDTAMVTAILESMREQGSTAAPGYTNPEGVVVFHTAGNVGFKKTLDKDEMPKAMNTLC
jgi:hypothetical protein